LGLTALHTRNDFNLALRLLDTGRRMLSEMAFQRSDMRIQFAFWPIVVQFLQLLQATLLVQFEILAKSVFGDANQFCNLTVWQPMSFQPQRFHAPLHQWRWMVVPLIVDFFQNFWQKLKLDCHSPILSECSTSVP
jgi:hypothetical protein